MTETLGVHVTFFSALGLQVPVSRLANLGAEIGEVLPLDYFLCIVRGIKLKGAEASQLWDGHCHMLLFLAATGAVALKRYRQTLDREPDEFTRLGVWFQRPRMNKASSSFMPIWRQVGRP